MANFVKAIIERVRGLINKSVQDELYAADKQQEHYLQLSNLSYSFLNCLTDILKLFYFVKLSLYFKINVYLLRKLLSSLELFVRIIELYTGCPNKHGNSVTNSILLWMSNVMPNFKSHNIIMSARVYFMKRVKDCKDVSITSLQDEQWRLTSLRCLYTAIFLFY